MGNGGTSATAATLPQHVDVFNHDLLMNPGDVDKARVRYPALADFLDWPVMRKSFAVHEDAAKACKRRFRQYGFRAVFLGVLALSLAAAEPRMHGLPVPYLDVALSIIVFCLSVSSIFYGHTFMRGQVKEDWLHHRAAAERIRQFHFQWLVRRAFHIAAASSSKAKSDLLEERKKRLISLDDRLEPGREAIIEPISKDFAGREAWLVEKEERVAGGGAPSVLNELLAAYLQLRFEHQSGFSTKTLSEGKGLWPWQTGGREKRLITLAALLTVLVVIAHLLIAIFAPLFGATNPGLVGWTQTVAMIAALAALGTRVLEDGMRMRADVARYRRYGGEVAELQYRFANATDNASKLALMERLEELSYRELRDFLTDHRDASFLI
jgi:hypothetical protein